MKLARATLLFALSLTSPFALAAVKTVKLSVPGMTCELCPITVNEAISRVPGVSKVEVTYDTKQAVVTFDDAKGSLAHGSTSSDRARPAFKEKAGASRGTGCGSTRDAAACSRTTADESSAGSGVTNRS